MKIGKIVETCIYSRDLVAMKRFYWGVIGLEVVQEEEGKFVFLNAGKNMLLMFNPDLTSPTNDKLPLHGAACQIHFVMEIDGADYVVWKERLVRNGIAIESEVGWKEESRSLYFRDPAGNLVELITPGEWPIDR